MLVRLGGEDPSSNFEDRTGQSGGFGLGGGGGSNLLGCLLPMVMSRFGFVGVLILLLGYCALTQLSGGGGGIIPSGPTTSAPGGGASKLDPNMRDFLTRGLGSTEETWTEIFAKSGLGTADCFVEAASDVKLVSAYDTRARSLEGYLFPDTYALPRSSDADDLVAAMLARFDKVFDSALRAEANSCARWSWRARAAVSASCACRSSCS